MSAPAGNRSLGPREWRGIAAISACAAALFAVVRSLPTGTNLSHMDFRVQGANVIEFCDPANPQFLPVVAVRSPVTLELAPDAPARAGSRTDATLVLKTFSGKPIAPPDLLVVHTRPIHLLIVDPSLDDYQHVHPAPGRRAGEWRFSFTPRFGGAYRLFADFTPVATNRGLYAEAQLEVAGPPSPVAAGTQPLSWSQARDGYTVRLTPLPPTVRAGVPADLTLDVTRDAGGAVPLGPVMDAYAHLVAFDAARSGFAHIHPRESDLSVRPDPVRPELHFRVTIPSPGRYVIWSQLAIAGREELSPFWFEVSR